MFKVSSFSGPSAPTESRSPTADTAMQKRLSASRRRRGEVLPEMPIVLWVIFMFLFFPLLNLATSTVRAYFIRQNVLEAAHRGSKAMTYIAPTPASSDDPSGQPSARDMVVQCMADFTASGFGQGGCSYSGPAELRIVRIQTATGNETTYPVDTPLGAADIDPAGSTYYLEVTANAQANPFLPYSGPVGNNIPGLTGPMPVQVTSREMFENVSGLSQ